MIKVYDNLRKPPKFKNKTIISVGAFDGLHLAHNQILKSLLKNSKQKKTQNILFTFKEPPKNLFSKKKKKIITTIDEKTQILNSKKIDNVFFQDFNNEFANLSAELFIKNILIEKLNLGTLIVGDDHKFGKNQQGNNNNITQLCKKYDFEIIKINTFFVNNIRVSSTNIRNALAEGDIKIANSLLGYEYSMTGKVISGNKIGRRIGFPTANLQIETEKLIPKEGVYVVLAEINNKKIPAMCNIGNRPTMNLSKEKVIEIHIINFKKDIYNQEIKIHFLDKIRQEHTFNNSEELINQLKKDKIYTTNYFLQNF